MSLSCNFSYITNIKCATHPPPLLWLWGIISCWSCECIFLLLSLHSLCEDQCVRLRMNQTKVENQWCKLVHSEVEWVCASVCRRERLSVWTHGSESSAAFRADGASDALVAAIYSTCSSGESRATIILSSTQIGPDGGSITERVCVREREFKCVSQWLNVATSEWWIRAGKCRSFIIYPPQRPGQQENYTACVTMDKKTCVLVHHEFILFL